MTKGSKDILLFYPFMFGPWQYTKWPQISNVFNIIRCIRWIHPIFLILSDQIFFFFFFEKRAIYLWKWGSFSESIPRRAFINKMGHSVRAFCFWKWDHFSERAWSLVESKMRKIKRGSFGDRRFENRGQCGLTSPSHTFRECHPQKPKLFPHFASPIVFSSIGDWLDV